MLAKDSAIGSSFGHHVIGGYRFLMRFYHPGDEIYFFGFSRGAYIARFLAEMLDYVGLLSNGNEEMVSFAWKSFSQWQCRQSNNDPVDRQKKREMYEFLKAFRETFSRPVVRIRFLGLFDTVNSVPRFEAAWMERNKFPYTARSSAKVIRHAVSIDERRAKFRQDLIYQQNDGRERWRKSDNNCHKNEQGDNCEGKYRNQRAPQINKSYFKRGRSTLRVPEASRAKSSDDEIRPQRYRSRSRRRSRPLTISSACAGDAVSIMTDVSQLETSELLEENEENNQDIQEVWYLGGHADVGGGWDVKNGHHNVSHIPLVWMVREAQKAGLNFDPVKVIALGCQLYPSVSHYQYRHYYYQQQQQQQKQRGQMIQPEPPIIQIDGNIPLPATSAIHNGNEVGGIASMSAAATTTAPTTAITQSEFNKMIEKASMEKLHDSLIFGGGLSFAATLSWNVIEWLPFRRMDLGPNGLWKPIRWPLPRGETRDIPHNVTVHGSVIKRMQNDKSYRPGNLIVGGGGRGSRIAPEEYGIGEWVCVAEEGDPVGELWMRKRSHEFS